MTTVLRRRGALFAAFTAAALLVTGCGAGPNQAQAAAVIGDSTISLGDIQNKVNGVIAKVPDSVEISGQKFGNGQDNAAKITNLMLRYAVYDKLTSIAAQRENLHVDQAQLDALVKQATAQRANPFDTAITDAIGRDTPARHELLISDYARKYWNTLKIDFDFVLVPSQQDAHKVADDMAAHPDQIARIVKAANGLGVLGQQLTPASWAELAISEANAGRGSGLQLVPVFGARAGTVLAVAPGEMSTAWMVINVRSRTVGSPTGTPPQFADLLSMVGSYLLGALGADVGVRINPRYGSWDPIGEVPRGPQVVSSTDPAGGFVVPVRAPRS